MEDSRCSMQPVFRNAKTGNGQKWSGAASGGSAGFYGQNISALRTLVFIPEQSALILQSISNWLFSISLSYSLRNFLIIHLPFHRKSIISN